MTTEFSAADAQYLIHMAESAPLANMRQAVEAQGVISRAATHFNGVFTPPAPTGTAEQVDGTGQLAP